MSGTYAIDGHGFTAPPLEPGLYVCATPIGNLGDVTLRALRVLAAAHLVACEDTRVTATLTRHYAIRTKLIAYHEHNAERQLPLILARLEAGEAVALVSDAGTPLVSDPGYRLVRDVIEAGHAVFPIPGASAVAAALVASGLPTDTFLFAGFLPNRQSARRKRLGELADIPATLVLFESPRRTVDTLADMAATLGAERPGVVAREITKAFETIRRAPLGELAAAFAAEPTPRGEIVILAGPPGEAIVADETIDAALAGLLADRKPGAAAAVVAAQTGRPRRELYARALALKGRTDDDADDGED